MFDMMQTMTKEEGEVIAEIRRGIGEDIEVHTLIQDPQLLIAIAREEAVVAVLGTRIEEDTRIKVKDMAETVGMVEMVEALGM